MNERMSAEPSADHGNYVPHSDAKAKWLHGAGRAVSGNDLLLLLEVFCNSTYLKFCFMLAVW